MSAIRALARLMLVLALLAGGLVPAAGAVGDVSAGETAMAESCHDLAGDPVGPREAPPAGCCEGGCACDCVKPVQAGLHATLRRVSRPEHEAGRRRLAAESPSAAAAPEVRPPIA